MQVIVHAGLHKSGTTSLQEAWRRAYADHPAVWYPPPPPGPPGHHRLFRPLLRAFTDGLAPDLLGASVAFQGRGGGRQTLAASWIAVICGTPVPDTTRVVQIEPGPTPTLTASAPASISAAAAAPVAMLPATMGMGWVAFIRRTMSITPMLWRRADG